MSRFDAYSKGFFGEEEEKTKASLSFDDFDAQFEKQFEQPEPELNDLSQIDDKITKLPFDTMEEYRQSIQKKPVTPTVIQQQQLPPVNMPSYNENRQVMEVQPTPTIKKQVKGKSSLDELNAIPEKYTPIAKKPGFNVAPTKMVQEQAPLPQPMISSPERAGESQQDYARELAQPIEKINELKNKFLEKSRTWMQKSREVQDKLNPEIFDRYDFTNSIVDGAIDALLRTPKAQQAEYKTIKGKAGYFIGRMAEPIAEFATIGKFIPKFTKLAKISPYVANILHTSGSFAAYEVLNELAEQDPDIKNYTNRMKESAPYIVAFGVAPLAGVKLNAKDVALIDKFIGAGYKLTASSSAALMTDMVVNKKSFEEALPEAIMAGGIATVGGGYRQAPLYPRKVKPVEWKQYFGKNELPPWIYELPSGQQPVGLLQSPQNVLSKRPIKQDGPATIINQPPTELYPGMPMTKEAGVQGPDAYFDRTLTGADTTAKQLPRFTENEQINMPGTSPTGMDTIEQPESSMVKPMLLTPAEEATIIQDELRSVEVEAKKAMTRNDGPEVRKLNKKYKSLKAELDAVIAEQVAEQEPQGQQDGAGQSLARSRLC